MENYAQKRNGVAFICTDEMRRCVMGFNPVSNRIATIRLKCMPVNMINRRRGRVVSA